MRRVAKTCLLATVWFALALPGIGWDIAYRWNHIPELQCDPHRAREIVAGAWPARLERYSGDEGGTQRWIDCAVLNGDVVTNDFGETYSMSPAGRRRVESLLAGPQP